MNCVKNWEAWGLRCLIEEHRYSYGVVPIRGVNRAFKASRPNALWVFGCSFVSTWSGFVYVAFVIDDYARHIVGWRVGRSAHAGFLLDALEQALHDRKPVSNSGLVYHFDRGVQNVSIKYTERLAEAGLVPSVGSVCDSSGLARKDSVLERKETRIVDQAG